MGNYRTKGINKNPAKKIQCYLSCASASMNSIQTEQRSTAGKVSESGAAAVVDRMHESVDDNPFIRTQNAALAQVSPQTSAHAYSEPMCSVMCHACARCHLQSLSRLSTTTEIYIVSDTPAAGQDTEASASEEKERARPVRAKKPNAKVMGPDWVGGPTTKTRTST